jgi:S-adenosylmethionine:tRNA ribosyltransferase-isomerase
MTPMSTLTTARPVDQPAQLATLDVTLRPELEAHEPPEARGASRADVQLMVSRTAAGEISHHAFEAMPDLLLPGDLLVVNNSATLPAAVVVAAAPERLAGSGPLTVHFSTSMPDGSWLVELRSGRSPATTPFAGGAAGLAIRLPAGAVLTLERRFSPRLWHARLSTAVLPYLLRHGQPIRYSYVRRPWPIEAYQTVFATWPGSAEMPSAARPFTPEIVTRLVSRGVTIAPITLHTGVSSLEGGEDPYPESYDVPATTARLVNLTRQAGGRIIAAGTTVVRALESAALERSGPGGGRGDLAAGRVRPAAGWTSHVVTAQTGVVVVDGLLTGLHEPRSTHLWMLAAVADAALLRRCYQEAADRGYRWHEFGDVHLLLP